MRFLLLTFAICAIFVPALAQQNVPPQVMQQMQKLQNMTPQEQAEFMANMITGTEKMHRCMEELGGEAALKDLEEKGKVVQRDVKALCAAGKRNEAQDYANKTSREWQADPRIKKLQGCADDLSQAIPEINKFIEPDAYLAGHHICDEPGN